MSQSIDAPKKPGRPRAQDPDTRRQTILEAAYHAFIESGFARTSTADIARRANVSKRTIYEVFSTKTELFAEVIRQRQHLLVDLPRSENEALSVQDTLVQIFRLDIAPDAQKEREAILNLLIKESILFPELTDYLYQHEMIRSREMLIDWLQMEMTRGRIPEGDVLVYAGMLMDIVFGALVPRRRLKDDAGREERTEHIRQRLAIFCRGVSVATMNNRPASPPE
jgi:Transcriptional regulator